MSSLIGSSPEIITKYCSLITDDLIVIRLQNCRAVRIECEILFAKLLIDEYDVRGEREPSRDLD